MEKLITVFNHLYFVHAMSNFIRFPSRNLPTAKLSCGVTWMWNLKYDTNELIYKIETDSQITETRLWLPKGKGGGVGVN